MGWRYHAGLGLIGAFVFIFVSSAEITQVCTHVFPFVLVPSPILVEVHVLASVISWLCFEDVTFFVGFMRKG